MRVLCDFQDTIGGAPRSLKEHALLLKAHGHEIIAVISVKDYGDFFDNTSFQIIQLPRFYTRHIFKNIWLLNVYTQQIKKNKIDLLYTNRVTQSLFLSIVSDFANVPILNARAGGAEIPTNVKVNKDKHFVVYSEENLQVFRELGFSEDKLFLLRNRIPAPIIKSETLESLIPKEEILITITGSIKEETLKGIIWFLNFVSQNLSSSYNVVINIAGGSLLSDGGKQLMFETTLEEAKRAVPFSWKINYLGYVSNITELQEKSHICIGKGRSVIQPAMMGKITFVISEGGRLYRSKHSIYKCLRFYNFSGRGNIIEEDDSVTEFKELLIDPNIFPKFQDQANILSETFKEDYATEFAIDKLQDYINVVIREQFNFSAIKGIIKLVKLYWSVLMAKV